MRGWCAGGLATVLAVAGAPAVAQDRAGDNAVTQADDAFGLSVGRESIGIYSSGNTRGFSPSQAGNIRLDGLYYDDIADPDSALIGSVAIKVGLGAQGYPFAAPSGIVDIALRRPGARPGASFVVNTDSFGTIGVEVDGSQPITAKLQLGYGFTGGAVQFPDGTSNANHGEALLLRWRPSAGVEITPFWSLTNDYHDQAGVNYLPASEVLPPAPPFHRFDGPYWSGIRLIGGDQGVLATITPGKTWTIRGGLFRSVSDAVANYSNFLVNEQPDGTGERITDADPPELGRSLSGELRVSHTVADGPRLHLFQLSVRGRDTQRQFGGTAQVDLGPGRLGQDVEASRPDFAFGPRSTDHVDQINLGASYDGRWKNIGELGISIGHTSYRDDTRIPGSAPAIGRAQPWIGDATLALDLTRRLIAYAGYARGLEQSGVAPATAANRSQPLGAVGTSQRDAGLRWAVTGDIKLIVGVFDLKRPYFDFNLANVYTQVGTTDSRGAEVSVNGHLSKTLTLVAGGYALDPRVTPTTGLAQPIGTRPVALPLHYAALDLSWQTPVKGVGLDLGVTDRGRIAATADDQVYLPTHLEIEPGARYGFRLAGHHATLRVQIENLLDDRYFGLNGPGLYVENSRRYATAYLAVDW